MPKNDLSDAKAFAFLRSLFPGSFKNPSLIAELCPEGWPHSPLFACFHPPSEDQYREHLAFSRSMKELLGQTADPSAALQGEADRRKKARGTAETRKRLVRSTRSAMRKARTGPPPETVQAYQEIYRKFPDGWAPAPYPGCIA